MLNRISPYIVFILLFYLFSVSGALALSPEEVMVLANSNEKSGIKLARFYMEKRHIPLKNLLVVDLTFKETCSRKEYEENAVPPVRAFIKKNDHIRAIVTMFGIPLRIAPPDNLPLEIKQLKLYQQQQEALENQLTGNGIDDVETRQKKHVKLSDLKKTIKNYLRRIDKRAAFDSELALVKKEKYTLNMWLPNPFYLGFRDKKTEVRQSEVLMVSRLDGPDAGTVKRIINDTLEAEKEGLEGKAYFDARWAHPGDKPVQGYTLYDKSIHEAARFLEKEKRIPVVLNQATTLFQPGDCPDTALYCGWYSLANYVDAFKWQKGSVGYHIASSECTTLRKKKSQVWCKRMLEEGIAATVGPVGEPYVQAFPVPELFFNYLTEGYLTLAESYLVSLPFLSWKMVLIGDPLYRVNLK